jgi:hypothetical protein
MIRGGEAEYLTPGIITLNQTSRVTAEMERGPIPQMVFDKKPTTHHSSIHPQLHPRGHVRTVFLRQASLS